MKNWCKYNPFNKKEHFYKELLAQWEKAQWDNVLSIY